MNVAAGMIGGLGWPELLIIVFVLMLLFGAKKLPDMARGTGRALRIFKAETKGLMEDDDEDVKPTGATPTQITQAGATPAATVTPLPTDVVLGIAKIPPTRRPA